MNNIFCYEKPPLTYAKKIDTITATNFDSELTNTDIIKGEYIDAPKYATMEYNEWRLDGSFRLMDDEAVPLAFWSSQTSNASGNFSPTSARPTITITFTEPQVLTNILILPEQDCQIKSAFIQVYNNNAIRYGSYISQLDDNTYCRASIGVTEVDKIVITILSVTPYRYLKIRNIKFGRCVPLPEDKFYNINLLEEISIPSDRIPMNTLSFTLKDTTYLAYDSLVEYIKQYMTYIELYKDLHIFGGFYLDDVERQNSDKYTITCLDAISLLDKQTYNNLFISTKSKSITLQNVISSIFDSIQTPYTLSGFQDSEISIKFQSLSKRDALAHLLLSSNAVCRKLRDGTLDISRLDTTVKKDITDRIFAGYNIVENTPVASISMKKATLTQGSAMSTSGLTAKIVELGSDYVMFGVKLPDIVWAPTAAIYLSYFVSFEDEHGVFAIDSSISSVDDASKVSFSSDYVYFKLDTEGLLGYRPHYQLQNGKWLYRGTKYVEWTDINWRIQDADWSTFKLLRHSASATNLDSVTLRESNLVSSAANPNATNALKTQDLQIDTVQIASLTINSVTELGQTTETTEKPVTDSSGQETGKTETITTVVSINNILPQLMERYYQYNKVFEGKILAEGLHCGDAVLLTLAGYGDVIGTIFKLEFNLINKEIANASILLYI